jgi:hypothetical protein
VEREAKTESLRRRFCGLAQLTGSRRDSRPGNCRHPRGTCRGCPSTPGSPLLCNRYRRERRSMRCMAPSAQCNCRRCRSRSRSRSRYRSSKWSGSSRPTRSTGTGSTTVCGRASLLRPYRTRRWSWPRARSSTLGTTASTRSCSRSRRRSCRSRTRGTTRLCNPPRPRGYTLSPATCARRKLRPRCSSLPVRSRRHRRTRSGRSPRRRTGKGRTTMNAPAIPGRRRTFRRSLLPR